MGIYAKDRLEQFAFQNRVPEKKGYTYDFFVVIQIDTDYDLEDCLLSSEDWEYIRKFYIDKCVETQTAADIDPRNFGQYQINLFGIVLD